MNFFGVGDDHYSWSYDGIRSQKFHGVTTGGVSNEYWQESFKWGPQDVIRVAMNVDDGELKFFYNHNDLGTAYNFPVTNRIINFENDEEAKEVPLLPYFPAITCQQSAYSGEISPQIIIQRAKMRYSPPEGYSTLGELMEEKQYVDKISLTHVPDSMTGLAISLQLKKYIEEMESRGLIEVPPPVENINVDAGEHAQKQSTSTSNTSTGDLGYDFNW